MTNQDNSDAKFIRIRKRPWYAWIALAAWVLLVGFLIQNAVGSAQELEPRAAAILWVSTAVVLLAGIVIGVVRGRQ